MEKRTTYEVVFNGKVVGISELESIGNFANVCCFPRFETKRGAIEYLIGKMNELLNDQIEQLESAKEAVENSKEMLAFYTEMLKSL